MAHLDIQMREKREFLHAFEQFLFAHLSKYLQVAQIPAGLSNTYGNGYYPQVYPYSRVFRTRGYDPQVFFCTGTGSRS